MTKFGWQSLAWLLAIVAFAIWMAATTDQGRRRQWCQKIDFKAHACDRFAR